jgi:hypothetical protein
MKSSIRLAALALGAAACMLFPACKNESATAPAPAPSDKPADKASDKPGEKAGGGDGASAGGSYTAVEVTNGGSISGTVSWKGERPKLDELVVHKNPEICGKSKPSPRLTIGAEGGVQNTLIVLEGISKGRKLDAPAQPPALDQKTCEYSPHIQIAQVGGKLEIRNSDPLLHNVHAWLGTDSLFNLSTPLQGMKIPYPLKRPGMLSMKCDAGHTWMSAYVYVAEHPYVALTDAAGKFKLEGVPPGTYKVKMWHEGWKAQKSPDGTSVTFGEPVEQMRDVTVEAAKDASINFELTP